MFAGSGIGDGAGTSSGSGIGIGHGSTVLGTLGDPERMAMTVISSIVNTSSRIESLTKEYKVPVLLSEGIVERFKKPKPTEKQILDEMFEDDDDQPWIKMVDSPKQNPMNPFTGDDPFVGGGGLFGMQQSMQPQFGMKQSMQPQIGIQKSMQPKYIMQKKMKRKDINKTRPPLCFELLQYFLQTIHLNCL